MHTCIYTGLVTYTIELYYFRIGDEINIKGDKQAPIIELELLSILFENLYTDFRRSSANIQTRMCVIHSTPSHSGVDSGFITSTLCVSLPPTCYYK